MNFIFQVHVALYSLIYGVLLLPFFYILIRWQKTALVLKILVIFLSIFVIIQYADFLRISAFSTLFEKNISSEQQNSVIEIPFDYTSGRYFLGFEVQRELAFNADPDNTNFEVLSENFTLVDDYGIFNIRSNSYRIGIIGDFSDFYGQGRFKVLIPEFQISEGGSLKIVSERSGYNIEMAYLPPYLIFLFVIVYGSLGIYTLIRGAVLRMLKNKL
jgi:hypothetical protein